MLEIASQMILCLLLAALLGAIIGYLLGKSTCADDDCGSTTKSSEHEQGNQEVHTMATTTVANPTASLSNSSKEDDIPMLLTGPRNGQKDNLTRIKGIGMKIEEALNDIGIYHFDQIAAWDAENIAWADSTLGFPGRAEREEWVAQAKALHAGEETEFSKRVDAGEVATSKQD